MLTLIPLALAGVVTLEICVLIGLQLNFANIIALPLLLGVGVAFKIYYITAWRAGQTQLLQSPLTRAVMYSALATATAFGSLWLSSHPGTSSMGKLLALSLVTTLAAAVLFQPVLMGRPRRSATRFASSGAAAARRPGHRHSGAAARRRLIVDPRPALPAAEHAAHHASLDAQRVVGDHPDIGVVGLAVLRVVDLSVPARLRRGPHVDQHSAAQRRAAVAMITAGLSFPGDDAPEAPRQLSTRMMALPSSVRQSPVGSAAMAVPLRLVLKATRKTLIARRMVGSNSVCPPGPGFGNLA